MHKIIKRSQPQPKGMRNEGMRNDEVGIALQTVILSALFALAAVGAGIIIFNVVSDESTEVSTAASQTDCLNLDDFINQPEFTQCDYENYDNSGDTSNGYSSESVLQGQAYVSFTRHYVTAADGTVIDCAIKAEAIHPACVTQDCSVGDNRYNWNCRSTNFYDSTRNLGGGGADCTEAEHVNNFNCIDEARCKEGDSRTQEYAYCQMVGDCTEKDSDTEFFRCLNLTCETEEEVDQYYDCENPDCDLDKHQGFYLCVQGSITCETAADLQYEQCANAICGEPGTENHFKCDESLIYISNNICPDLRVPYWGRSGDAASQVDYITSESNYEVLSPVESSTACTYTSTASAASSSTWVWGNTCSGDGLTSTGSTEPECRITHSDIETHSSWELVSFCVAKGGALSGGSYLSGGNYLSGGGAADLGTCIIPDSSPSKCSDTQFLNAAFNSAARTCSITAKANVEDEVTHLPSGNPSGNTCLELVVDRVLTAGTQSGNTCTYPNPTNDPTAAEKTCELAGLTATCSYTLNTATSTDCPDIYHIDKNSGDAKCRPQDGSLPAQWHQVCLSWHDVAQQADSDTTSYARYNSGTEEYECVVDNSRYNTKEKCENFGYKYAGGECMFVAPRAFNAKPIAPTCITRRLLPYSYTYVPHVNLLPYTSSGRTTATDSSLPAGADTGPTSISIPADSPYFFDFVTSPYLAAVSRNYDSSDKPFPIIESYPVGNIGLPDISSLVDYLDYALSFDDAPMLLDADLVDTNSIPTDGACNYDLHYYKVDTLKKDGDKITVVAVPDTNANDAGHQCTAGVIKAKELGNHWQPRFFTGVVILDKRPPPCEKRLTANSKCITRGQNDGVSHYVLTCRVNENNDISNTKTLRENTEFQEECRDIGFTGDQAGKSKETYTWTRTGTTYESQILTSGFGTVVAVRETSLDPSRFSSPLLGPDFIPSISENSIRYVSSNGLSSLSLGRAWHESADIQRAVKVKLKLPVNEEYPIVIAENSADAFANFLPTSAVHCEFSVDTTNPWLKACRNLDAYYDVRISYYDVQDGWAGGVWASIAAYNDPNYFPPTYFNDNTNRNSGKFYCEVSDPGDGSCAKLNDIIGKRGYDSLSPRDADDKDELNERLNSKGDHIDGFFFYEEGPRDHYPCKWASGISGSTFIS